MKYKYQILPQVLTSIGLVLFQGDSGGPSLHRVNGHYELAGVVSFSGTPCLHSFLPSVHVDVLGKEIFVIFLSY
jgi:hypothetical protein